MPLQSLTLSDLHPETPISLFFSQKIASVFRGSAMYTMAKNDRFADDVKPYESGDEISLIDWHRYQRTNQLFTRQKRPESMKRIKIIIDLTPRMFWPVQDKNAGSTFASSLFDLDGSHSPTKAEIAIRIALNLGYQYLLKKDDVVIHSFDSTPESLKPLFMGNLGLSHVLQAFFQLEKDGHVNSLKTSIHEKKDRRPTTTILISDGLCLLNSNWLKDQICMHFLHVLHEKELNLSWLGPNQNGYSDVGQAREEISIVDLHKDIFSWQRSVEKWCQDQHIPYALVPSDQKIIDYQIAIQTLFCQRVM